MTLEVTKNSFQIRSGSPFRVLKLVTIPDRMYDLKIAYYGDEPVPPRKDLTLICKPHGRALMLELLNGQLFIKDELELNLISVEKVPDIKDRLDTAAKVCEELEYWIREITRG